MTNKYLIDLLGYSKEYFYEHQLYSENEYILMVWRYGIIGLAFFLMKTNLLQHQDIIHHIIYSDFTYYFMLLLTIYTVYTLYSYIINNIKLVNKLFGIN